MDKITINLSFYNQDNILRKHVLRWTSWPKEILKYYSFCIVDDCSNKYATEVLEYIDKSNTQKIIRNWKSCEFKPYLLKNGWMPPGALGTRPDRNRFCCHSAFNSAI